MDTYVKFEFKGITLLYTKTILREDGLSAVYKVSLYHSSNLRQTHLVGIGTTVG